MTTRGNGDLIPYVNVSKLLTKLGNEQQLVTEKSNGKQFAQTSTDASVSLAEDRLLTRFLALLAACVMPLSGLILMAINVWIQTSLSVAS